MHWEALLQEVLDKKSNNEVVIQSEACNIPGKCKETKKFFLGINYKNVYFTNREAEVMVQLLQGKTLGAAATILNLSPRTIEFYVKNMKSKLACRTKSELIGKVFASDFVKNVDFIANLMGPLSNLAEESGGQGNQGKKAGVCALGCEDSSFELMTPVIEFGKRSVE
jgi:DNA-binding CsgD family transcriptional regulator